MATYAIGDIQGCFDELRALLGEIRFDGALDCLWFTGDLVNRGPRSLETLRFVRALGDRAVTVLGNHDLHLLAVSFGHRDYLHRKDTLGPVLEASDGPELLDWLRQRPLMHRDQDLGYHLVHAGLPPQWSTGQAWSYAQEVQLVLRGPDHAVYFDHMYGNKPYVWNDSLEGFDRLRFITNCFTRLRYCQPDGALSLGDKGPPGSQSNGALPWFEVPGRASAGERILFGHWSTLQLNRPVDPAHGVIPLDNGCLWGGSLSAFRLEDGRFFHLRCKASARARASFKKKPLQPAASSTRSPAG